MRGHPWVSVVVATRNQGRFLKRCLDSLLLQSLERRRYEILVVNDGSTDSTRAILEGYGGLIVPIHLKRHRGLAAACNEGLERACGEYFVRVDSDDWLDQEALAEELKACESRDDSGFLLPDYWEVRAGGRVRKRPDLTNVYSWIAAGSLMRRAEVQRLGGYRPLFWEEADLYLRLLEAGSRPVHLPVPVLFYRRHGGSMTSNRDARLRGWRELAAMWPRDILSAYGSHRELESIFHGQN